VFSGRREDFPEWRAQWEEFLGAVKGMVGSGLGNRLTLMLLDEQIDEASKVMLKARRRANPDLSYLEFFAELCQEFAEDSFLSQRSKWKRVRLEKSGGKVTLTQWRKFKAQLFDALRGGVQPHPEDLREALLEQLPDTLREAVIQEEAKRQRNKYVVCLIIPPSLDRAAVLDKFGEELGLRLSRVQTEGDRVIFDCHSAALRMKALAMDGLTMGGAAGHISVNPIRSQHLPPEEIIELLDEQFWTKEEVGARSGTPERQGRANVRAVDNQPSPKSSGKGKGKGKGGEWKSRGASIDRRNPSPQGFKPQSQSYWGCNACRRLQKPHDHPYWECPIWQATRRDRSQEGGSNRGVGSRPPSPQVKSSGVKPLVCFVCQKLQLPCKHDFRTCPKVAEQKRDKEAEPPKKPTAGDSQSSIPKAPGKTHSG
jgi:hypothetical protein